MFVMDGSALWLWCVHNTHHDNPGKYIMTGVEHHVRSESRGEHGL